MMMGRQQDGWVYIMADRNRGTMYAGVTAHLSARIDQYRSIDLIECDNPEWQNRFALLV